ncbi:Acyltransferase family protein [Tritrichomonas foetus]|uniref:Acyltransferase family protein n=1 Tax=Tritrichomonas foetus TaxID=1144522 RepID=A0A1J4JL97_9EUKA|nr:Acyltransferase family protein [Tritrichomonas foetus]|eukprot:OHS98325.1 Acyltransferase family protein [Tritrichomonas foetus]
MPLYFKSTVPRKSKEYQNQTEISSITQEEYDEISKPFQFTSKNIIFQIICSLIFFTPIRLIFNIIIASFMISVIFIIQSIVSAFQIAPHTGRKFCLSIARFGIRCILFCFGVFFIKTDGHFDETARFIIANHIGLLEPFILLIYHDFSYPINQNYYYNPITKVLLSILDAIYLPSKRQQARKKMVFDTADDFSRPPLLIFPEGLKSKCCGDILMKFDSTAFSTPYKVQPIAIRFTMFGVPEGFNTYAYKGENIFTYLWRLHTIPLSVITVSLLPSISIENEGKSDIQTFVSASQLSMANYIGIQAVDMDERLYYKKHKKIE